MRDLLVGALVGCIASKKSMKFMLAGSYSSLVVGRLLGTVVGAPLGAAEGNAVGRVGCGVGKAVGAGVAYFAATSGLWKKKVGLAVGTPWVGLHVGWVGHIVGDVGNGVGKSVNRSSGFVKSYRSFMTFCLVAEGTGVGWRTAAGVGTLYLIAMRSNRSYMPTWAFVLNRGSDADEHCILIFEFGCRCPFMSCTLHIPSIWSGRDALE